MLIVGFQVFILSLLASALSWNRRMIEELLLRERRRDYSAQAGGARQVSGESAVSHDADWKKG